jgi:cell division protein FtsA
VNIGGGGGPLTAGFVMAPYASAKSILADDELALGVTVIDMGGATTSFAIFFEGSLVFADVIPLGGQNITNDIARGLSTTIAHAERMKTLWGSALASQVDEREMISVPLLGERGVDTVQKVPKSMLTGIIRPRLESFSDCVICSRKRRAVVTSSMTSTSPSVRPAPSRQGAIETCRNAPSGSLASPSASAFLPVRTS